jgi:hypothetical protein
VSARRSEALFVLAAALATGLFLVVAYRNLTQVHVQQYALFAESLLHGRLDFVQELAPTDEPARHGGRSYLPLGPAPGLLLVPFAALGRALGFFFLQGYLNLPLVAAAFALALRLAVRVGFERRDAFVLAFAYVFASSFVGVASIPISNYFAHVLVTVLVLAALLEHLGRRRAWLVGLLLAAVLASRLSAGLGALFFAADTWLDAARPRRERLRALAGLALPLLAASLALGAYNAARFGDPFETGYALQAVLDPEQRRARAIGLAHWRHVPGNLYYLLLAPPQPIFEPGTRSVMRFPFLTPGYWGMSLFATSPWLAWLFALPWRDRRSRCLLAAALVTAGALAFTWSMGYAQFGYRFALDFLPYLYLALLLGLRERGAGLPKRFAAIVLAAACADAYLLEVYLRGGGVP